MWIGVVEGGGEGGGKVEMRVGRDRRKVKRPSSKLQAQLVNHRRFDDGSERPGNGLIAIEVFLESGRQVEAVVQRRLVQQPSIVDEIAHKHGLAWAEVVVESQKSIVGVICSENTAQAWFRRQAIDGFHFIDEFNVLEDRRIVERRFAPALDFIVAEDEGLVFLDRTSDRRA